MDAGGKCAWRAVARLVLHSVYTMYLTYTSVEHIMTS